MFTETLLIDVAQGRATFAHLAAQCAGDLQAMATHVAKRWGRMPAALQLEDLVQEMLLALHTELQAYEGRPGLKKHVVFRMCAAAKQCLKSGASRERWGERWGGANFDDVQAPLQEDVQLARELLDLVPYDERQRTIMETLLATGSLDAATEALLSHPDTATMFSNPARARRSVYNTAFKLSRRAQAISA